MRQPPIGISFPKSGRTWMRAVLRAANAPLAFTHAGHGSRTEELGRAFAGVPAQHADRPILFLHRNPLDTAVSFYFQVLHKDFARGTFKWLKRYPRLWRDGRLPPRDIDAFVLHPTYGIEAVCRFNRGWLDHLSTRDDSLIVTYEALRAEPEAGFAEVLRFLGHEAEDVEAAVEKRSFENMRAREAARPDRPLAFLRPDRRDEGARKVRRGKVGGYVDHLRPETTERAHAIAQRFDFHV